MSKFAVIGLEKFAEAEGIFFGVNVIEELAEIVSKNIHAREFVIRIGVAEIFSVPLSLSLLFHDVIPSVDIIVGEIAYEVEGRTAKREEFSFTFDETFNNGVAELSFNAFVRLVDYDQIPFSFESDVIFIELAADALRAAQVLHRDKVDEMSAVLEQIFKGITCIFVGAVDKIGVVKNFIEVVEPTGIDYGAMSNDYSFLEIHTADDFERAEGFAETHFGIPEEFVIGLEIFDGATASNFLFGAEVDVREIFSGSIMLDAREKFFPLLNVLDSLAGSGEVNPKPLATGRAFERYSISFQQGVNVRISEGNIFISDGKFGVQKFVGNICGVRVSFYAFTGGLIEFVTIRREVFSCAGQGCLADFQKSLVRFVGNRENINQSALINFVGIFHARPPLASVMNSTTSPVLQSLILQYAPPNKFAGSSKGGEPVSPSI